MKVKDRIFEGLIKGVTFFTAIIIVFVIGFIVKESIPVFKSIGVLEFLFSSQWNPLGNEYGILYFILGSIYISLLSLIIALPLGLGCAVFLSYYTKRVTRNIILSFVEMLAGIPSVIFGFVGLLVIVKFFENNINMTSGECMLAGAILLAIMILPFIIDNCYESIEEGRKLYDEASLNLSVSKWYTFRKVILRSITPAIMLSCVLAFSRSIGETMAVMMVIGNSPIFPRLLGKGETIPSLIALEMGSVEYSSIHYSGLYGAALVLIIIVLTCNISFFMMKGRKKYEG